MRSDRVYHALAQGMNRFEVCQIIAKGVRATHKSGDRFEDTINSAMEHLGSHERETGRDLEAKPLDPAA